MIFIIAIVIISLVLLMAIHELGHFLLAKKFGIQVDEFGIGYPPRLIGKKIGSTIYSLNLLPFGAFVKILGEDNDSQDKNSFGQKKIWQRMLVILGGVFSFWLVAFLIFTVLSAFLGMPTAVDDSWQSKERVAFVQILDIAPLSPAQEAGLVAGDRIKSLRLSEETEVSQALEIDKVGQVQDFAGQYAGKEIIITIQRGDEEKSLLLTPRIDPPSGQGAIGVALARVVNLKTPWYQAPVEGAKITIVQTKAIPLVLFSFLKDKISGQKSMSGVQLTGPIGVGKIMVQAAQIGPANFLMLIAMLSIWLALFNLLPIPALDGGRALFLIIEAVRRKPIKQNIEQKINAGFFLALIGLMIFVTIKDIIGLF